MIERLVLLKLRDPSHREALAAEARRVLPGLPGVREVKIGLPADPDAEVWDLAVTLRFDGLDEAAALRDHPDHVAFVDQIVAPHVAVRKAWNFVLFD